MKNTILAILFTTVYLGAGAQVNIEGQVKSKATSQPLSFASIVILNAKDSALTMSLTDEKGYFRIPLDKGSYKLVFRFLGYKDDTVSILAYSDKNLGIIYLEPESKEIEKITVTAELKREEIDKEVVLVTKEMKARSANVKDLLEQAPGVSYDRYNNQISVDGETNILILVNGLKKSPEYIEALNPERIWKIEIIRDPGGRYGLEGYSAIINVILKDNFRGFEFYTEGGQIYAPESQLNKLISSQGSINLNYTYDKINLYSNLMLADATFPLNMTVTRIYNDGQKTFQLPTSLGPSMIYKAQFLNFTAGTDYKINPLHTLSLEFRMQNIPNHNHSYGQNLYQRIDSMPDGTVNTLYELTKTVNPKADYSTTLFYKGKANHGLDMQADVTVGKSVNSSQNLVRIYPDPGLINYDDLVLQNGDFISKSETGYLNANGEITYTTGRFNVTGGGGYNYRNLTSTTQIEGQTTLSTSTYNENRYKGYLYLGWKPSAKFNVKLGAAYELYALSNETIGKTMPIWQPYADIKWSPFKLLNVTLKYRTKSDYPSADQLNPTQRLIAYRIAQVGNPDLMPATNHRISLRTNVLGGLLSIEPYYSFTNNYIAMVYKAPETTDLDAVYTFENTGKYTDYGTKLNLTIPFGKKIILQNNLTFYWQQIEYDNKTRKIHDWKGNTQLIYYNPKIVTFGITYQNMTSKNLTAQGYRTQFNDFVGMFVMKEMFKKRLSLMVFYIFPFNPHPGWLDYDNVTYTEMPVYTETSVIDLGLLKNVTMFRLTYRFSKGKTIKVEKQIEKQENLKIKSIL